MKTSTTYKEIALKMYAAASKAQARATRREAYLRTLPLLFRLFSPRLKRFKRHIKDFRHMAMQCMFMSVAASKQANRLRREQRLKDRHD